MLLGLRRRIACDSSLDACNTPERQDYLTSALSSQRKYQPKAFGGGGRLERKRATPQREQRDLCAWSFCREGKKKKKKTTKKHTHTQNTHPYSIYLKKIDSVLTRTALLCYTQLKLAGSLWSITHDLFSFVSFWHPGTPRLAEDDAGRAQLTSRQLVS